MRNRFTVTTTDDHVWFIPDLIEFLVKHQGQDIVLDTNPEAHSLAASGLYDILDKFQFRSVTILTWNVFEQHPIYTIKQKSGGLWFFEPKQWKHWAVTEQQQQWNQSKLFGVFYGRPTADRMGIAGYLYKQHRALSELVLAFDPSGLDSRRLFETNKLYDYHREGLLAYAELEPHLPMRPTNVDYENCIYRKTNTGMFDLYQNILIDIISEPNVLGRTFFLTEKVVRCLLLKKPFIIMGPQNSGIYLRQMGFQTFGKFWDEDYDGYAGKDRYLRILKLIDQLAKQDTVPLYQQMQSVLEHNYQMLINQTFTQDITEV